MKPLSKKIGSIEPSATIAITDRARRMKADGKDVISLSIGEPDFDTPVHIVEACIGALKRGETHYAPSPGIPELRRAVANKITKENGFTASPDNVIITCGAKDAIREACEAVLNPGDEVIVLDPCWVSYDPCIEIAGGVPVHHPLDSNSFQVTDNLLERITDRTKMIIINSPSNPSGSVLGNDSMRLIADIAVDRDIYVLSDEIYEKLIYDATPISVASLPDMEERTITVNGFSKAYAMTGWRLGYVVAPKEIIDLVGIVQQHSVSSPATFAMWGGVAALEGEQSCVENMRKEFRKRRDFMASSFKNLGFDMAPADGAFYLFVNVGGDDMQVAEKWLNEAYVASTPGTAFHAEGWIRLSYAASMENLSEAVTRISNII
jgi:aspartate aminotransferase